MNNKQPVKELINKINQLVDEVPISIMEVCGTHSRAIYQQGLRSLLSSKVRLLSGPGCPVCVTPQSYIDQAIRLSDEEDIIICCFGDLLRVPGNLASLEEQRVKDRKIKVVYSPLQAVNMAKEQRAKQVIFLAVGFETTAPVIALAVRQAERLKIDNFYLLLALRLMPPILCKLLADEEVVIDGLILPGHVATIAGVKPFQFIAADYGVPAIVAGFEAEDIALGLFRLVEMVQMVRRKGATVQIENLYLRAVNEEGNRQARQLINNYFMVSASEWRGMGEVEDSGLVLQPTYQRFDAARRWAGQLKELSGRKLIAPGHGCICGLVLQGKKRPNECKLFGNLCSPANPQGPCMVSQEGSCATYYLYGRWRSLDD